MLQQIVCSQISPVCKLPIVGCLEIGVEGVGDIRTLHLQQQLAFPYVIVEAGLDIDHAAIGQRDNRHLAIDVGEDRASSRQLSSGLNLCGCRQRKLIDILGVDGEQIHIGHLNDLCRRRRAAARIF